MARSDRETFFIGELADRTGVSRDTIRYYESVGVLPCPQRSRGGYRLYEATDVERISFVGQAQTLGLTLEEIAEVLAIVDGGGVPCNRVRDQLSARLKETRERIQRLEALEGRLVGALKRVDGGLPKNGSRCGIIEAIAQLPGQTGSPTA